LPELAIYRYGLIFFAVLSLFPAIVSGNMTQYFCSKLIKGEAPVGHHFKLFMVNFLIFVVCVGIICYAIYSYLLR
jgi:hypothetical protein